MKQWSTNLSDMLRLPGKDRTMIRCIYGFKLGVLDMLRLPRNDRTMIRCIYGFKLGVLDPGALL